jgi:hypothetical protein
MYSTPWTAGKSKGKGGDVEEALVQPIDVRIIKKSAEVAWRKVCKIHR